jgi:NAD(P)H-dependent FMN reductase
MAQPTIAIIIGTIREDRFGHKPARWILEMARAHGQAEYEIVDLRDYPLPFYNDAKSPMFGPSENAVAQRWLKKMAGFDGYIFITAEYNYGIAGALKNALDYAYHEFYRKPAAFVAYGEVGGARAVQQLRLTAVDLQLAPLRNAVHIGGTEFLELQNEDRKIADYPQFRDAAVALLDDLVWWTRTLKAGRENPLGSQDEFAGIV